MASMRITSPHTAYSNIPLKAAAATICIGGLYFALRPTKNGELDITSLVDEGKAEVEGEHNTQRKAVLATGIARDHDGSVVVRVNPDFDLDETIFASVEGQLPRLVVKSKLAVKLYWSLKAMNQIKAQYDAAPRPNLKVDKNITDFMEHDCNFKMEHADGSFLDHLQFCHEYSARHFKAFSPRVLFLHSIMGVGTNVFPMSAELIPQLRGMLTEFEFRHVQAFPSVLRLLLTRNFIADLKASKDRLHKLKCLSMFGPHPRPHTHTRTTHAGAHAHTPPHTQANKGRLHKLKSVSMFRPLDNVMVTLDAEDLWIHLNYHMCHLLDFLPVSCWAYHINQDALFMIFADLYHFMTSIGKVMAEVNLDLTGGTSSQDGQPLSLGSCIARVLPNSVKLNLQEKAIRKLSAAISHSLDYTLVFTE